MTKPYSSKSHKRQPFFEKGDVIDDRYIVEKLIGSGGFAQVWKVNTSYSLMPWAMKVLRPNKTDEALGRFIFERDILVSLNESHNGRTPNLDWAGKASHPRDETQEMDFIVMEYLEGYTLAEALKRGQEGQSEVCGVHFEDGRMTFVSFLTLMGQLLEALEDIHALGIVHRDIKPSNIMLRKSSSLNLCLFDLGIAKQFAINDEPDSALSEERSHTKTGSIVMSPHYFSREQLDDPDNCDPRTDLYSVGLIAYECLMGKALYSPHLDWMGVASRMHEISVHKVRLSQDIIDVAPRVARLIHSMLEQERVDRLDIFRDEDGHMLYDLEKDGASLTSLVKQTFFNLGRDATALDHSLSSRDQVQAFDVEHAPSGRKTEKLDMTPVLDTERLEIAPDVSADMDTHIQPYRIAKMASSEWAHTKPIRSDAFMPLDDFPTNLQPVATPEMISDYKAKHRPEMLAEDTARLSDLPTRTLEHKEKQNVEVVEKNALISKGEETTLASLHTNHEEISEEEGHSLTPSPSIAVPSSSRWKIGVGVLAVVVLGVALVANMMTPSVKEHTVTPPVVAATKVVDTPKVVDVSKGVERALFSVHTSQNAAREKALMTALETEFKRRGTAEIPEDAVAKKKSPKEVSSPKKASQRAKKPSSVATNPSVTTIAAKKEDRQKEDVKAVEQPKKELSAEDAKKKREEIQRKFSEWKVEENYGE